MSRRKPRRWHRRIAGFAVAVILWFALSGIVLNHAHDLALDHRPLPPALTRFFYARAMPSDLAGQRLQDHWFYALDNTLYRDANALGNCAAGVRGAADFGDWQAVACGDSVYVLDRDGGQVEHIDAAWGLSGIRALATTGSGTTSTLVIAADSGTSCVGIALDRLQPCRENTMPATPTRLPANVRVALAAALAPPDVDIERFVHDLHSGRLLGAAARWAWDLFAVALLALAASGWLLLRHKRA